MGLLDGLAELVAPTRCVGCELPGALLCAPCDQALPRIDASTACSRCGAPFGGLVCTECWSTDHVFEAALGLGELEGVLARAVVVHKDAGERRLGGLLGTMLAQHIAREWPDWTQAVCWVPPTRAAHVRRGFDHGHSLAAPLARHLGAELLPALQRTGGRDQRRLGRSERLANAGGTFSAQGAAPGNVLLVDDVLTTGATLDAASEALLELGASAVRVAVVARAW